MFADEVLEKLLKMGVAVQDDRITKTIDHLTQEGKNAENMPALAVGILTALFYDYGADVPIHATAPVIHFKQFGWTVTNPFIMDHWQDDPDGASLIALTASKHLYHEFKVEPPVRFWVSRFYTLPESKWSTDTKFCFYAAPYTPPAKEYVRSQHHA